MRLLPLRRVAALALLVGLPGCVFITQDQLREPPPPPPPPVLPGALQVQVLGPSGTPAPGVPVTVDGVGVGVTDGAGWLGVAELEDGWHALGATPSAGPPTGGAVEVRSDQGRVAVLRLATTRAGRVHRPATGGAIGREGEYSLVFGDSAFLGADPEAPLDVTYAWVEPGSGHGPVPLGEGGAPLDLVAVAWIGSGAASAADYPLDPDVEGTLRIPAPVGDPLRALPDPEVFWFDDATGTWVARGRATLEEAYLSGTLRGPGWWALGTSAGSFGCLSGTLSEGASAAGTLVTHLDPLRPLPTVAWADDTGAFCAPAVVGHAGRLELKGVDFQAPRRFGLELDAPAPGRPAECGDSCADLGALALEVWEDADGDGFFGGPGGDCDDSDPNVAPDVLDAIGGSDENCDGVDGTDADRDGVPAGPDLDCDDLDPSRAAGLPELCDGIDNDCDDDVDEDIPDTVDVAGDCRVCGAQSTVDLGPKLYLHFDDLGTSTPDSSGFGFDAAVSGLEESGPSVSDDGVEAPRFSGVRDDFVKVTSFPEMGTDALTVSMFLRPTLSRKVFFSYAVAPADPTWDDAECAANSFLLLLNPPNAALAQPGNVSLRIRDWSVKLPNAEALDAWEHLVVSWRSTGEVQAYKNGELVFEGELTTENQTNTCEDPPGFELPPTTTTKDGEVVYPVVETTLTPGGSLYFGQDQDCLDGCSSSTQAFEGLMDEVAVFDRVLNPDEVETLWRTVTCGEGFVCDDLDQDLDGLADEHLLGSDNGACLADDCEQILATDSSVGTGNYWVDYQGTPTFTTCTFPEGGDCSCRICGDGVVAAPYESCDAAGDPTCRSCANDLGPAFRTCADVLAADPSAEDGVYWIYPDGAASVKVRCDFTTDGGGWTQVFRHDTRTGQGFYDPTEPRSFYSSTAGLFPWDSAATGDPFASAHSILSRLESFRGGSCGFDFRMTWPFDNDQALVWSQTSNPTQGAVEGFVARSIPASVQNPAFRGLRKAYDLDGLESAFVYSNAKPPDQYVTARVMADFDENLSATWYPIALYLPGVATDRDYRMWASEDITPDGTTRGVELWVRPCVTP